MTRESCTFSCGHTEIIDIAGSRSVRSGKLKYIARGICSDCKEQEKREEYERAAIQNAEFGLPEMFGTEKQIEWAETIRNHMITEIARVLKNEFKDNTLRFINNEFLLTYTTIADIDKEVLDSAFKKIQNEENASWWIDNRSTSPLILLTNTYDTFKASGVPSTVTSATIEPVVLSPEGKLRSQLLTKISVTASIVSLRFPEKDDKHISICRASGMSWKNGQWTIKISDTTGTAIDCAASLIADFLNAGFRVTCDSDEAVHASITGTYQPRCFRWIKARDGKFSLSMPYDDTSYSKARSLPGARWNGDVRSVEVPADVTDAIEDFADRFGFEWTDGARELLNESKTRLLSDLKITPAAVKKLSVDNQNFDKSLVSCEIASDLRDDD